MIYKFNQLPRKQKKALKRNFIKTLVYQWKEKEVKIKHFRRTEYFETPHYKMLKVVHYSLGKI